MRVDGPARVEEVERRAALRQLDVGAVERLDGAKVCVQTGTTGELNIADFFRKNKLTFKPVTIEESSEFIKAFDTGRCDVLTQDASDLGMKRTQLTHPDDYVLLPDRLSKEPLRLSEPLGEFRDRRRARPLCDR